jgi:hypothetical protein
MERRWYHICQIWRVVASRLREEPDLCGNGRANNKRVPHSCRRSEAAQSVTVDPHRLLAAGLAYAYVRHRASEAGAQVDAHLFRLRRTHVLAGTLALQAVERHVGSMPEIVAVNPHIGCP